MRKLYKSLPLVLLAGVLAWSGSTVQAQKTADAHLDTMVVDWTDANGDLKVNALWEAIQSDTTDSGERMTEDRVYVLKRGGYYYNTETIENPGFPLRIVGQETPEDTRPPVLQIAQREDGTTVEQYLNAQGDVTLKNVLAKGMNEAGGLPYEPYRFNAENSDIQIDNVIFEHSQWGMLAVYGENSSVWITDTKFRNLLSTYQPWGGRAISTWTNMDTVYVENSTFMNVGALTMQFANGTVDYFWSNHNTFVNNGRDIWTHSFWTEAYIANNLIVNGFWQGEDEAGFSQDRVEDPLAQYLGMFFIEPLPADIGLDVEREIVFTNAANYRPDALSDDVYANDFVSSGDTTEIRSQPLFNGETDSMFTSFRNIVKDNITQGVDPNFNNAPQNYQDMIDFINAIRQGSETVPMWYWDPNRVPGPVTENPTSVPAWPLPEDLAYSNSDLQSAAVGGYPLGDLNWYPDEKSSWMNEKESLAGEIKGKTAGNIVSENVGSMEAESASELTGGASVVSAPDTMYVELSAGTIEWDDVNVDSDGTYTLGFELATFYGEKWEDVLVNGTKLDEQIGLATDTTEFVEVKVEGVELNSGSNTIAISASWAYSQHRAVNVYDSDGNKVTSKIVAEADYGSKSTQCPEGGFCTSMGKFVDIDGEGSLSLDFDANGAGQYAVAVNYMVVGGDQPVELSIDGESKQSTTFSGDDSTSQSHTFSQLQLSDGTHSLTLSASGDGHVFVDNMNFLRVTDIEGEDSRTIPEGYALEQNYPNPFNPSTTIKYELAKASDVQLTVYNVLGQRVATLVNSQQNAGQHRVRFDARSLSSGVYFYRLQAENFTAQKQMMLIK